MEARQPLLSAMTFSLYLCHVVVATTKGVSRQAPSIRPSGVFGNGLLPTTVITYKVPKLHRDNKKGVKTGYTCNSDLWKNPVSYILVTEYTGNSKKALKLWKNAKEHKINGDKVFLSFANI